MFWMPLKVLEGVCTASADIRVAAEACGGVWYPEIPKATSTDTTDCDTSDRVVSSDALHADMNQMVSRLIAHVHILYVNRLSLLKSMLLFLMVTIRGCTVHLGSSGW